MITGNSKICIKWAELQRSRKMTE